MLRVVTYNVHRCVGSDGRRDIGRVQAVIEGLDADVVALQEVESFAGKQPDLLKALARTTGYRIESGPALRRRDTDYGNALLTRLPLRSVEHIDMSVAGREPRGAIVASVTHGARRLKVAAIHLGLRGFERRRQLTRLLTRFHGPAPPGITELLMGDVNEWFPGSRVLRRLRRHFGPSPVRATYPSRFPLLTLDRVYVRPVPESLSLHVHSTDTARSASDHLPLVADIQTADGLPTDPAERRFFTAFGKR